MTRTKATVKRRQQRRRLEREAENVQLREDREAAQQTEQEGGEEVRPSTDVLVEEARPNTDNQDVLAEQDRIPAEEATAVSQHPFDNEVAERHGENKEEKEEEEEEEEEGKEAGESDGEEGQLLLTDYEKQREQRIKENAAKLATLNLTSLASSLRPLRRSQRQASSTRKKKDDDYMPSSSSDSQDSDDDCAGPQNQQKGSNGDLDEDQALQEAIALSLNTPGDNVTHTRSRASRTQNSKRQVSDKKGSAKKRRKGLQEQFTVDEIAAIFAIMDEQGNGKFSVAELERVACSHDFTWSKQEIVDMIDIFDSDKDGQLDLSEFQSIFGRMNMLRMDVA